MNKMKNLFLLGMIAVSSVTFISCEKGGDDGPEPNPSVAIIAPGSSTSATPNSNVNVSVLAAAADGENLKSFRIQRAGADGVFSNYPYFPGGASDTTFSEDNYRFNGTLPAGSVEQTVKYRFIATDGDGRTGQADLTITVSVTASTITSQTGEMMGNEESSTGSAYATSNNNTYKMTDAKAAASLIDFVYYNGVANGSTFAAPSDASAATVYSALTTWSPRNNTTFSDVIPGTNFDNIDNATEIETAVPNVVTDSDRTQLAVGQVFGFRTAAGKKGVVRITSITGTNSTAGIITFEIKTQK